MTIDTNATDDTVIFLCGKATQLEWLKTVMIAISKNK
jgi:hypothetical protein